MAAEAFVDLVAKLNVPATLSADTAAGTTWEAVVIGAGPAGALAARQLALAGARTLLVDRTSFPRWKVCGACINNRALGVLRSVGLQAAVDRLEGVPLRQFRNHTATGAAELPLPGGVALSRALFDAALVQAAVQAGASFLPETRAAVHQLRGCPRGFRRVQLTSRRQSGRTILSRMALVADGLGHSSLPPGEFQSRVAARARLGIGTMVREFPPDYGPGTIFMAVGSAGYAGLVRIEDGALNVAAAVDPEFLKHRGGPAAAVGALLLESRLAPISALPSATWRGTVPLARRTLPLAGERVLVLGDAAGYVEPFTGEGIAWALTAAVAVTPLALEGIRDWSPRLASQWNALYRYRIARRQRLCRLVTAALRQPRLVAFLLDICSVFPAVAGPIVRRISGPPA